MPAVYDNWERLVAAVLRKEELWRLFHAASIDLSTRSESLSSDLAAGSWILGPASPYPRFRSPEVVVPREILEALRKEKFATPFRLVTDNGITTVVKRLRDAGISEQHLDVASEEVFFSCEDEKLITYEYEGQGGGSTILLHGKMTSEMYALEWESCVRIAICVAKAIANTHAQCNSKHAHGDIKAADDCFSDLGLEGMAKVSIVIPTAGYRAPEVSYNQPPSEASDVYSFGVLLIELLTGEFPLNDNAVNKMHRVRDVTHKFLEEGTLIVFDFVPARSPAALIEMWKTLLVAMRCLEENPEQRPKSSDVLKMMEGIKTVPPKNGSWKS